MYNKVDKDLNAEKIMDTRRTCYSYFAILGQIN